MYGDMQTAFEKFSPKGIDGDTKPPSVKFADIKIFLCAGLNACIEDIEDHITPFEVGKILDISKMTEYVTVLMQLMTNAMPNKKDEGEDEDDEPKN